MSKETIIVTPLSAVVETVRRHGVSHLVTLINNETAVERPEIIAPSNHLRLSMNDICEPQPGLVCPAEAHVEELIGFAANWDGQAPMLIHCWAGISRSTAAAFITLCSLNPGTEEVAIARAMRAASPTAYPNRRLVGLGDDILGRGGRMVDAVEAMGRGHEAMEGMVFSLPGRGGF
jgi:predicted protein tyrosine phosphatase